MEIRHTATRQARLSTILREDMQLSSGLMNRMKWKEAILVNGIPQHTDYPVQPGDAITVLLTEETPEYPPQEGNLQILFEDEHLLAVEKPAGMLIHPSRCCNTGTLANYVAGYYQKHGQHCAFHPVTRLDRDTFGIVLLAKNPHIHHLLQAQTIQKIYHALVWGGPEEDAGQMDYEKTFAKPFAPGASGGETLLDPVSGAGKTERLQQAGVGAGDWQDPSAAGALRLYGLSYFGRPAIWLGGVARLFAKNGDSHPGLVRQATFLYPSRNRGKHGVGKQYGCRIKRRPSSKRWAFMF